MDQEPSLGRGHLRGECQSPPGRGVQSAACLLPGTAALGDSWNILCADPSGLGPSGRPWEAKRTAPPSQGAAPDSKRWLRSTLPCSLMPGWGALRGWSIVLNCSILFSDVAPGCAVRPGYWPAAVPAASMTGGTGWGSNPTCWAPALLPAWLGWLCSRQEQGCSGWSGLSTAASRPPCSPGPLWAADAQAAFWKEGQGWPAASSW